MNPIRLFRLDKEIEKSKDFGMTPYGLEDPDDITRTSFVGSLIVGDNILQISFICTENYPKEPPKVKFSAYAIDNYESIQEICDDNGYLLESTNFITEYDESQSIGSFLDRIRIHIDNN